ncbi:MAG: hypothetical protein U5K79_17610 [Cyclobacteriaceae bacterium]|nr:hypothetical protein [Cyclobacteriaceae bacterium]
MRKTPRQDYSPRCTAAPISVDDFLPSFSRLENFKGYATQRTTTATRGEEKPELEKMGINPYPPDSFDVNVKTGV